MQHLRKIFMLSPVRHILALLGLLGAGLYFALHGNSAMMTLYRDGFLRPLHRFLSAATGRLPFSLASLIIAAAVLAALAYIAYSLYKFIKGLIDNKALKRRKTTELIKPLYLLAVTALCAASLIYSGFCWLWGVYYDTADFEERSGIHAEPVSVERLYAVTSYFTGLVNEYAKETQRNEDGSIAIESESIFAYSSGLYDKIGQKIPALSEDLSVPAKPFFPSKAMSLLDFTGFYFPFTGEANINTDCPAALIPATISHELAHLRGVAEEDEANFFGILACLEDGDPVYSYSACLLAYIHLGNALYSAVPELWRENYEKLCPEAKADLKENNDYWAKYKNSSIKKASNKVYEGFLQGYGQKDGLRTYGKCVDLLIAYFAENVEKTHDREGV